MSAPPVEAVLRRADATRNRRLLLEAAAQAFAEGGIDVPAGEIARRAGVAKGTLFRHFPTKSELVAAVLVDRMAQLRALIAAVTAEHPPGLEAVAQREVGVLPNTERLDVPENVALFAWWLLASTSDEEFPAQDWDRRNVPVRPPARHSRQWD